MIRKQKDIKRKKRTGTGIGIGIGIGIRGNTVRGKEDRIKKCEDAKEKIKDKH